MIDIPNYIILSNRCDGFTDGLEKCFLRPWLAFSDIVFDL